MYIYVYRHHHIQRPGASASGRATAAWYVRVHCIDEDAYMFVYVRVSHQVVIHMYIYIHIYIYIQREREQSVPSMFGPYRQRPLRSWLTVCTPMSFCIPNVLFHGRVTVDGFWGNPTTAHLGDFFIIVTMPFWPRVDFVVS